MFNGFKLFFNNYNELSRIETKYGEFLWIKQNNINILQIKLKINSIDKVDRLKTYISNYMEYNNDTNLNLVNFEINNDILFLNYEYFKGYPLNLIIKSDFNASKNLSLFIFKQLINIIKISNYNSKNGVDIHKNFILINENSEIKLVDIYFLKEILKIINNEEDDELELVLDDDLEFITDIHDPIQVDYKDEIYSSIEILYELINNKILDSETPEGYQKLRNKDIDFIQNIDPTIKTFLHENIELNHSKRISLDQLWSNNFYINIFCEKEIIDFKTIIKKYRKKVNKKSEKPIRNNKKNSFSNFSQFDFLKIIPNFIFN